MAVTGYPEPSSAEAIMRGVTRRCPRCGRGKLFSGWFTMTDPCPRCHLALERDRASFLGSMTLNYSVTGLVLIAVLVLGVALTVPDVQVVPIIIVSVGVVLVIPAVFYPFSKTIWAALDYLAHRHDPGVAAGGNGADDSA